MTERNDPTNGTVYEQSFAVSFDYPVHFVHNAFAPENGLLASILDRRGGEKPHKLMVFVDAGVAGGHPGLVGDIETNAARHADRIRLVEAPAVVAGGEHAKNGWGDVRRIMESLGRHHMCRQSAVLAIGGGSVLDMVGFAVSLVHRGLRIVRAPSTVLAQNDAGVGVKTGMNEHDAKNYAGTFAPPFAVINDAALLPTLPQEHWIGGVSEAFKVAVIKDAAFLDDLVKGAKRLRNRDLKAMEDVVYRCAVLHLEHIRKAGDPFEMGSSRPLDFGHWSAHQLEVMSQFAIGHGRSVAIGVALDTVYAARVGLIAEADMRRVVTGLQECGLPVWHECMDRRGARGELEIFAGLDRFREHLGGELTLAMPHPIGRQTEVHEVDRRVMEQAIASLKQAAMGSLA
jgi:3-dehydroquinate synthase